MCKCNVGPGRYEGEGPITVFAHSALDAGDDLSWGDGSWAALELGPFPHSWEPGIIQEAREAGYCDDCIDNAMQELEQAKALTYGADSQGFLWSSVWCDADAAQAAYDADLADLVEAEAQDA